MERPRERLLYQGASNLSLEELLSILLGSGTKGDSVKQLSSHIMKIVGEVGNLKTLNLEQLQGIKGIGESKASKILAAIELGVRIHKVVPVLQRHKIVTAQMVYQYYKDILGDMKQEYFYCLYLDSQKRVIRDKLLFVGTLNYSLVHPREIFKEAYLLSASSVVCVHNHPSGDVMPSKEDMELTKNLSMVGNILGIKLTDHVIVSFHNYYSFYENNQM